MLKTLFSPKVEDICPNCGKACATNDVLCPNCGKNLDELFERIPDPVVSPFTFPRWMVFPMKASGAWRVLNSLILIIAFVTPWEIVYSDVLPSKPFTLIGLQVFSIFIPNNLLDIFSLDCLYCIGTGLIAIGYLGLTIYAVLNFLRASLHNHHQNLQKALRICVITSGLFFLRIVTPMMLSAPAWGYWLACIGLLSSLWLEAAELIANKSFVDEAVPKAA